MCIQINEINNLFKKKWCQKIKLIIKRTKKNGRLS